LGVTLHESAHGFYPTSGWGWRWIGDPDRGTGPGQPGGWIYQILPYVEQSALQEIGAGLGDEARRAALSELSEQVIAIAKCPTRPAPETGPLDPELKWRNAEALHRQGRTDYVGNGGSVFTGIHDGPQDLATGDDPLFQWTGVDNSTGIFARRNTLRSRDVVDGLTNTYMLGEKHVCRNEYDGFDDPGYDQSAFSGDDWDTIRWTSDLPLRDSNAIFPRRFGGPHASTWHVACCDGSVHAVQYTIDSTLHRQLGNRADHNPTQTPF
jgi:hypothetical protein